MNGDEVKLSPEEVERVMSIIQQAYTDMEAVAHGIGAHSDHVIAAYQGGGTSRAQATYQELGRAGQALANALDGLSQDLGLTAATGRETDADAESALNRVDTSGIRIDLGVAQGI
ncbi:WXG100 family type VII secretion target [Streptomyces hoynatensis]|uniref:WXG100 family type VII secretion target n=1 Tax=Streptomyces hoynatensis TaxID=1141874 RepID=UPI0011C3B820|nr:WXG100 family type VII secretion target [Streptomyces hoynatensis]